LQNKI